MNRKQFIFTLLLALLSGLMGGVLSIWFLLPPSVLAQGEPQKVITAQEFRVVDEDGQVKVLINVLPDGSPSLILFGESPALALVDQNLESRLMIGIFADQKPGLVIYDKSGNSRAELALGGTGNPRLTLQDEEENKKIELTVGTNLRSTIRAILESGEKSEPDEFIEPHMILSDGKSSTWITTSSLDISNERPHLTLTDEESNTRAVLGSTELKITRTGSTEIRAPSSLVLFDEEGNVVWSAP